MYGPVKDGFGGTWGVLVVAEPANDDAFSEDSLHMFRSVPFQRDGGRGGRCPYTFCVIGQRAVASLCQKVCLHTKSHPVFWRRCACSDLSSPLG